MKAAVDEANAKKAADEAAAAAAAAAAAIPAIVQEPPKRLKKIAPLEPSKLLAISAPSGPVEAPPPPALPAKVKRAPNAYALAVGKYRKEGKSFAEAAALAKAETAKAKLPAA
jgi:hypothetical protein